MWKHKGMVAIRLLAIGRLLIGWRAAMFLLLAITLPWGVFLWREPYRIGQFLIRPLEHRFHHADVSTSGQLTGLIVLTGDDRRLAEAGRLARRYPNLKVVISGAEGLPAVPLQLGGGIEASRIILEMRAKNTFENAVYSTKLIRPRPGEHWLLVTGGLHMPRAVGAFRKAGFDVEPWPIDDVSPYNPRYDGMIALREALALLAYRLLGRTYALFPGPADQ